MCVVVLSLNHAGLFATPRTVARQAPLSVGFPGQEYWSGLPCSPPGGLPNPGGESHISRIADELFTAEPLGKPSPLLMATKHEFNSLRMKLCPLQSSSLPSVTLCPFPPLYASLSEPLYASFMRCNGFCRAIQKNSAKSQGEDIILPRRTPFHTLSPHLRHPESDDLFRDSPSAQLPFRVVSNYLYKNGCLKTSLMVQCLELCLPIQGLQGRSLVRELRSHTPLGQNIKHEKYCNKLIMTLKMAHRKKKSLKHKWFVENNEFSHKNHSDLNLCISICNFSLT